MAVDAPVGEESHEMHGAAGRDRRIDGCIKHLVLLDRAIGDSSVDAGKLLVDDPSGTHVQVTDL
jgi:hypothetical protein